MYDKKGKKGGASVIEATQNRCRYVLTYIKKYVLTY